MELRIRNPNNLRTSQRLAHDILKRVSLARNDNSPNMSVKVLRHARRVLRHALRQRRVLQPTPWPDPSNMQIRLTANVPFERDYDARGTLTTVRNLVGDDELRHHGRPAHLIRARVRHDIVLHDIRVHERRGHHNLARRRSGSVILDHVDYARHPRLGAEVGAERWDHPRVSGASLGADVEQDANFEEQKNERNLYKVFYVLYRE